MAQLTVSWKESPPDEFAPLCKSGNSDKSEKSTKAYLSYITRLLKSLVPIFFTYI